MTDLEPLQEAVLAKARSKRAPWVANLSICGVDTDLHPYVPTSLPRSSAMMRRMFFCSVDMVALELEEQQLLRQGYRSARRREEFPWRDVEKSSRARQRRHSILYSLCQGTELKSAKDVKAARWMSRHIPSGSITPRRSVHPRVLTTSINATRTLSQGQVSGFVDFGTFRGGKRVSSQCMAPLMAEIDASSGPRGYPIDPEVDSGRWHARGESRRQRSVLHAFDPLG